MPVEHVFNVLESLKSLEIGTLKTCPTKFRFIGNLGVSESPDVLEALRFIPKGCPTVAGGRSVAETTGMVRNEDRILEGCQKRGTVFRRSQIIEEFWHPSGMHRFVSSFPGVSAATPGYFLTSLRDEPQASNQNREILALPQDAR